MSDGDGRAAAHHDLQSIADQQFGLGVDARRRLVENEDARVERERPRERQQLLLADRQCRAALGDDGLEPVRQPVDEPIRVHGGEGAPDLCVADLRVAETDIGCNGPREQVHVLQDEAEL
ncbi:hypothetical protein D3C83_33610 [compost metagenome]